MALGEKQRHMPDEEAVARWQINRRFAVGQSGVQLKAAPGAGLALRVRAYVLSANGQTDVTFKYSGAPATDKLGPLELSARVPSPGSPIYELAANKALLMDSSGAVGLTVFIRGDTVRV